LERISGNLEESLGVRGVDLRPRLSPVASAKDIGRRPLRNFGTVDINQVIPDPDQPRVNFSEEEIERLAESIREKGQLSPIRVRWAAELEKWVIIFGERRWRATRHAGLPNIDCFFHDGDISKSEILEQQLIENLLREDLSPIEEAKAYQALMELNEWNGKQVADALRIPASKVTRVLALLDLPPDVQKSVEAGELAARTAYETPRSKMMTRGESLLTRQQQVACRSATLRRPRVSAKGSPRRGRAESSRPLSPRTGGESRSAPIARAHTTRSRRRCVPL
jgi:ParB family chromosome partitioning protein